MQPSIVRNGGAATALRAVSGVIVSALLCGLPAIGQNPDLQQKVAALKQSAAANQQRLHQYQWTETVQVTYKGDPKPPKQNLCQYGANGQVQKTPIGDQQQQQPSGGRFKQRIVEKKKAEMQDYMGDVKGVLAMYVPPDPQKIQAAFQAGNASFSPANGGVNLVFKNYAQPGDQMTITFNPEAKKITALSVNTYTDKPSEVVTLAVQFASLPDGTNYAQQSVLNATAKQISVTTTNSGYQKLLQ
ncbi:MAG TPA: hypothetical protein VE178_17895 [Silvibacterium sp.]|jgi:hypothetical protein|nr:hypothetical protein [Silvibacterium sp.]